jgi:hypothetical protein
MATRAEYGAELTVPHVAEDASDLARTEAVIVTHTEELDKLVPENKRQGSQPEDGGEVR